MADTQVTVSIENLSPSNGTLLTPLWVGFHNGEFDTYNRFEAVSPGLESLAEDGATATLSQEFISNGNGQLDGQVGGAPIAPGTTATANFTVDPSSGDATYFSYASMVIPSNDFFISNGNPEAHRIFDDVGNFIGSEFLILGSQVLDAGTEVNDELPANTAAFGQAAPNTGQTEGVVRPASGFIPGGPILSDSRFTNADFTASNYTVGEVTVTSNAANEVTVSFTNRAPNNGTTLTPLWVGFHDGTFDTYNTGEAASPGLERLAEDGNAAPLGVEFVNQGNGIDEGPVGSAPIAPGETVTRTFTNIDFSNPESAFFSYASMILPSNDFFISNGNPAAHRIIDEQGNFIGANFTIAGSEVLDAGTEVSDEVAANVPLLGQAAADTGLTEGVVNAATGFIPNGRILSSADFSAADYTAAGYEVARVRVTSDQIASTFSTDFSDLSSASADPADFQFGTARFTGGSSFFVGVGPLYSSNPNAWVAEAGETLRIDFDQPVSDVSFRAIGLDGATVRVIGEVDQASNSLDVTGDNIKTTDQIQFTGNITAVELINTSTEASNFAANGASLDDLSFTVAGSGVASNRQPDFNGDNQPDLLWRNTATGENLSWLLDGTTFAGSTSFDVVPDPDWELVDSADFNGDGESDLLWRNNATGSNIAWFLENGVFADSASFGAVTDLNWQLVGSADFNRDDQSDLLWHNRATGEVVAWYLNGTSFAGSASLGNVTEAGWELVGTGDFNSDDQSDLIWRNRITGSNLTWLLDGFTISDIESFGDVADPNWQLIGSSDFNGDSQSDLIWRNSATGENLTWLLNGSSFADSASFGSVADSNWQLVA